MSGEGSFPHQLPEDIEEDASPEEEPSGARVFEFPLEDMPTPTPIGSMPVPAGTWADEGDRPSDVERLLKPAGVTAWKGGGEVVEFPRQPSTRRRSKPPLQPKELRPADVSGTQVRHAPTATGDAPDAEAVRPKFLASELLERDWRPHHPLRHTLRWAAIALGVAGAVAAPLLGGLGVESIGVAIAFAVCAAAGLAPLPPGVRGIALAVVGVAGASWIGAMSELSTSARGASLLIGCVTLTASALFFRAAHNRSALARALVAVGLLGTAAWLGLTGGIDALVVPSLEWHAWIAPVGRLLLAATAVLTLLTFLDPTSPGGAWVAGYSFVGWLALSSFGELVVGAFSSRTPGLGPVGETLMAHAALPLFVALAAGGLCQVWVMASERLLRR